MKNNTKLKPTIKVSEDFNLVEINLMIAFNRFKEDTTITQYLSDLTIEWGKFIAFMELFNIKSKLSNDDILKIYSTIKKYSNNTILQEIEEEII